MKRFISRNLRKRKEGRLNNWKEKGKMLKSRLTEN
jgi:hypothetical protein